MITTYFICLLFTAISLVFLVLYIIYRLLNRKKRKNNIKEAKTKYSWVEILWPLNTEPFKIYKHLTPNNKVAFWSICGTILIGVFSTWLGFTVQHIVYNASQTELNKLSHYQLVEKFTPAYKEFVDSTNSSGVLDVLNYAYAYSTDQYFKSKRNDLQEVIYDFVITAGGTSYMDFLPEEDLDDIDFQNDTIIKTHFNAVLDTFLQNKNNWPNIINDAKHFVKLLGDTKRYYSDIGSTISTGIHNKDILLGVRMYEITNDTIYKSSDQEQITQDIIKYLTSFEVSELIFDRFKYFKLAKASSSDIVRLKNSQKVDSLYNKEMGEMLRNNIITPMLKNQRILRKETMPNEGSNNWFFSVTVLLLALFIGYMVFRVLFMKVLSLKSLEPNPMLSQEALDEMRQYIKSLEQDAHHYQTTENELEAQIMKLQGDLRDKELENNQLKERIRNPKKK